MKHYILALLLLCYSLLHAEGELFHGIDLITGELVLAEEGFNPLCQNGQVIELINSQNLKNAYSFVYSPENTTIIDAENHRFQYTHDGKHILAKMTWDHDGSLFGVETRNWNNDELVNHAFFDGAGALLYQQKIEHTENSVLITTFDQNITTWIRRYYEEGRLVSQTDSSGQSSLYFYTPENLISSEINVRTDSTLRQFYFYNSDGYLTEIITDDGNDLNPSCFNDVLDRRRLEIIPSMKHPEVLILYRYDPALGVELIEKRIESIYSDDAKIIFEEFFDQRAEITTETYFEYDALGHLISLHDGKGNGIESSYDIEHHLLRQSTLADNTPVESSIYNYEEGHQPSSCDILDSSGSTNPNRFIYNTLNQISTAIDCLGNQTNFCYNPLGQLTKIIHPAVQNGEDQIINPTQEWHYNCLGRLVSYTDPCGRIHPAQKTTSTPKQDNYINPWTPSTHPLKCPKKIENASVAPFLTESGSYGTKLSIANDCDTLTTYSCDALNRVTEIITTNLSGALIQGERMRYNASGNPVLYCWYHPKTKEWITTTWSYTPHGNLELLIEGLHTPRQRTTTYRYDDGNRLLQICKPNGTCVNFTYDESSRLNTITSSDGTINQTFQSEELIVKQYDDQNRCVGFILPDGSAASYSWDANEITDIYRLDATGKVLYNISKEAFVLQEKGRFAKPRSPPASHDELFQLQQCGERFYRYDANGNVSTIKTKDERLDLTYDALDRLITVSSDDGHSFQYTYDGCNRRIERICSKDAIEIYREFYLYDGMKEIGTMRDGKITQFRLLDPSQKSEIGATIAIELDGQILRPVHDSHQNIKRLLSFENNQEQTCYRYDSWRQRTSTEAVLDCPWRFRGKRTDEETGFVFFGRRFYMPYEGRWLTADPMGYIDSPNRYLYCSGKPGQIQDHYGLFAISSIYETLSKSVFTVDDWLQKHFSFEQNIKHDVDHVAHQMFSNAWLVMLGYYKEDSKVDVVGNGELNDKVRVTIINGMLNMEEWAEETAMEVSKTHADINVHYIYRATRGWFHDLLKATLCKLGFVSSEAKLLAQTWKELIAEMGGPEEGGTIVHYAHSIGAADTLSARLFLSPEEQKMIKVISLGSPLVIPHEGFGSVINYISLRDGIRYLALFAQNQNFVYLDSYWGIPVIDHLMNQGTYKTLMENLGKAFIKEYIKK